jgi:hypothetical protein
MKLKSFCTMKEMVTRLTRQPTDREKILASYTSEKGLFQNVQGAQKTKLPKNQRSIEEMGK